MYKPLSAQSRKKITNAAVGHKDEVETSKFLTSPIKKMSPIGQIVILFVTKQGLRRNCRTSETNHNSFASTSWLHSEYVGNDNLGSLDFRLFLGSLRSIFVCRSPDRPHFHTAKQHQKTAAIVRASPIL
jgi:hypothetical protein